MEYSNKMIERIAQKMYKTVLNSAKNQGIKRVKYRIRDNVKDFYIANIEGIIKRLQELLKDCTVKHTIVSRGKDGRLYDISEVDESILPLLTTVENDSYIFINCSHLAELYGELRKQKLLKICEASSV